MYERVNDKATGNEPKVRKSTILTRERETAGRTWRAYMYDWKANRGQGPPNEKFKFLST